MNIPKHVAIIMDGNGRWATKRNLSRSIGHLEGSKTLKKIVEYAFSNGIEILSVFAFSTENFKRSKEEVNYLMNLFVKMFKDYFDELNEKGIKIVFSKKESGLPSKVEEAIKRIENDTKNNKSGIFNICINYGGRSEIVDACKKITNKVLNNEISVEDINEDVFSDNLYNKLPDIDLLIRTSGEYRISNFMMWQLSYSEMYFTDTYFPDFKPSELDKAFINYSKRDRRYGGINNEKKSC